MRNLNEPWNPVPLNWTEHIPLRDPSVVARTDMQTHPVANPVTPGYAFGTLVPFTSPGLGGQMWINPYLLPVGKTFQNQIPDKAQIQGVVANRMHEHSMPGYPTSLPGPSVNADSQQEVYNFLQSLRVT